MSDPARRIAENLAHVRSRIDAAAQRSGRTAEAIRLVAVTKYVPLEVARATVAAGCHELGESRPQQLWERAESLAADNVRWHLVGHLQRNKVRRTLPLAHLIQSLDSLRVLEAVEREAAQLGRRVDVLVEVNVSADTEKTGLLPAAVEPLLERAVACNHVAVRGLMGMARRVGGTEAARRDFAALRELRDRAAAQFAPQLPLAELSMGMSGDFEQAIEEGATMVRLGSILFEGIQE